MEIINVSGYVTQEKMNIASKYLSPQAKEASGLKDVDITIEDSALQALIRYYCRESGVRNLKKHIEKVSFRYDCLPGRKMLMSDIGLSKSCIQDRFESRRICFA
jgi:ATP-dependent Lon protease